MCLIFNRLDQFRYLKWILSVICLVVALATTAQAIPPKPPWLIFEERAEREGILAVRKHYRDQIDKLVAKLDKQNKLDSLAEFRQCLMTVGWLFDYSLSWAYVEARAIRRSGNVSSEVVPEVFEPMLRAARVADGKFTHLQTVALSLRMTAAPEELKRYKSVLDSVDSLKLSREVMAERIATLAKLAGDRDLVVRAFDALGGRVRSFRSANEFLANPPDFDRILKIAPTAPKAEPKKVPELLPLTPEEKEAIRDLIQRLGDAVVAKNSMRVAELFEDSNAARKFVARLQESRLTSFDLSNASFRFERISMNVVLVHVEGVSTTKQKDGRDVKSIGRKTYRIILRDEQAMMQQVGGSQ